MKSFHIPLFLALSIISGCQNDIQTLDMDSHKLNIEEFTGIQYDIAINILTSRFGGYQKGQPSTRSFNQVSITPYIEHGDTVFFIAQYADGWEIYSASQATNMILFSSEHGSLNLCDPNLPAALKEIISSNADAIHNLKNDSVPLVDASWGAIALTEEDFLSGEITELTESGNRAKVAGKDIPEGRWILLESEEIGRDTYTSPKLTKTEWHQTSPWNNYIRLLPVPGTGEFQHAPAGCTTIALSQYLYYTHFKDNVPEYTHSCASLSQDNMNYIFFGFWPTTWNQMAINSYCTTGFEEAAIFIGSIAKQLNNEYSLSGTSHKVNEITPFLNSIYRGSSFNMTDFSFDYIETSIDNKYPIITSAGTNKNSAGDPIKETGHTFLIDQYKKEIITRRQLFGLERYPLKHGEIDRWMADMTDENGNIIKYAYTNEVITKSTQSGISMNWGTDIKYYNDVFYSPNSDWTVLGYNFNLRHEIVTRTEN